jgi:uncharacterized membrane protein
VNPFDLKAALLAKHAQHVVVIHFPIALFLVSCAFDVFARWRRSPNIATAAYYNLVAATFTTLPAVATGLLAWQWQLEGKRLTGNLRLHLLSGLTSTAMIWLLFWWRKRLRRTPDRPPDSYYLAIALITVLAVSFTGHLGGILSGVEAPG